VNVDPREVRVRAFDDAAFERAFTKLSTEIPWQEEPEYYSRYRTRYEAIVRRFAERAPTARLEVLDIGGGQYAYLAAELWGDDGCVADLDDSGFPALRALGLDAFQWNVGQDEPATERRFDAIFFSEVIAHLPVPGHVPLRRLRGLLRPGGLLLCSTPNLYRLRNVALLLSGRPLFGHFDLPSVRSFDPVIEYSHEHLAWQFQRAGFLDCVVELHDFAHAPYGRLDRVLHAVGAPLRRIPRYRGNLLAVATAPSDAG
jgi:SAM-dependent methyltransferase